MVPFQFLVALDLRHAKDKGKTLSEMKRMTNLVEFFGRREGDYEKRHAYFWTFKAATDFYGKVLLFLYETDQRRKMNRRNAQLNWRPVTNLY